VVKAEENFTAEKLPIR